MFTPHTVSHSAQPDLSIAEIVTIGDELNRGEIVDSNAAWLAEQVTDLGFHVRHRQGVNDEPGDIAAQLALSAGRAQVVLCCGGLGPTSDDLTVDVVAQVLGVAPVSEPAHEQRMRVRFAERNFTLTENNLRQVRVPPGATVLENRHGLAPGFAVRLGGAELFFMPGVPREMKPMFETEVIPRLRPHLSLVQVSARRTFRVIGPGESHVDHRLRDLLDAVPGSRGHVTIHYRLAFPEILVTLVVRAPGEAACQALLDRLDGQVRQRLGGALYSQGQDSLQVVVGHKLRERGETVATAESCTGGMIGELLTAVPGSSAYYLGGVISYANSVKVGTLGVSEEVLREHGAVSKPCVEQMARGVRRLTGATYGVAVSGVAGPDGGTPDKPVGTVHVAVTGPAEDSVVSRQIFWPGDREQVRRIAAMAALNILHKALAPERARADESTRLG